MLYLRLASEADVRPSVPALGVVHSLASANPRKREDSLDGREWRLFQDLRGPFTVLGWKTYTGRFPALRARRSPASVSPLGLKFFPMATGARRLSPPPQKISAAPRAGLQPPWLALPILEPVSSPVLSSGLSHLLFCVESLASDLPPHPGPNSDSPITVALCSLTVLSIPWPCLMFCTTFFLN